MSQYQLNKLLRDLSRSNAAAVRYQAEPDILLHEYDLTVEESDAARNWRVRRLFDLGVNPLLLLTSSMAMGIGMREYMAALKAGGS